MCIIHLFSGPSGCSCFLTDRKEASDDIDKKELEEESGVLEPGHSPTTGTAASRPTTAARPSFLIQRRKV